MPARILVMMILAVLGTNCGAKESSPASRADNSGTNIFRVWTASSKSVWHSIQRSPPAKPPKIYTCEKFNPIWWFGNADEPAAPDWFKPGKKGRTWKWYWRNPFHNLTHYVIGIVDKKHRRSGRHPEQVSNPNGGWNFAVAKYKILRLPFLSYRRGKFEFYFGWRVLGNFGVKINFNPKRTQPLPHRVDPSPEATSR